MASYLIANRCTSLTGTETQRSNICRQGIRNRHLCCISRSASKREKDQEISVNLSYGTAMRRLTRYPVTVPPYPGALWANHRGSRKASRLQVEPAEDAASWISKKFRRSCPWTSISYSLYLPAKRIIITLPFSHVLGISDQVPRHGSTAQIPDWRLVCH